ncbi:sensor histidine kinase [Microtetraspora niveoalba]|uniref:sensor histidine kinase n=1 Tax=Microtetraspora niveoalba TaxID=46175 RepID=UPI000834AD6D|nr:ATP-binding protein [Microtetraspora niveoalba]
MRVHLPARWSVRLRATIAATLIVAVALGGASAVLRTVLHGNLRQSAQQDAARRAATVADALSAVSPAATVSPATPATERPGAAIAEDPDLRVSHSTEPSQTGWDTAGYVVASAAATTGDDVLTVTARSSLEPAENALRTLNRLLIFGVPALLLLVAGMTWYVMGRALVPVSGIQAKLADITARDLHQRVPVPSTRDEIAALARTVNATLDRLENAVEQHKRFVADAAHELRSPIATLRTRLELAARSEPAEALADVERLQSLAADLLLLARLDAGEPPRDDEVDLGQVAAEESLRPRPRPEVGVRLAVEPDVVVNGSRAHLARLVTNLVDNAVRHARSTVEVRVANEDGVALLEVRDDGPGIPPEHRQAVFERFTRLDWARTRDSGGSGLGLAIVREIALLHGGTVSVTDRGAGACLVVRLAAVPQPGTAASMHKRDE